MEASATAARLSVSNNITPDADETNNCFPAVPAGPALKISKGLMAFPSLLTTLSSFWATLLRSLIKSLPFSMVANLFRVK